MRFLKHQIVSVQQIIYRSGSTLCAPARGIDYANQEVELAVSELVNGY